MLATSTGVLVKAIPEKGSAADPSDEGQEYEGTDAGESEDAGAGQDWRGDSALTDVSMTASPTGYSEGTFDMIWQGFNVPQSGESFPENDYMGGNNNLEGY